MLQLQQYCSLSVHFFVLGYLTLTHKQVMRRLDIIAALCAFFRRVFIVNSWSI